MEHGMCKTVAEVSAKNYCCG